MGDNDGETFTLLAIAVVVILVRSWYRWSQVGFSGLQLDDYLMPVSAVLYCTVTALARLVGASYNGLTNSYMTDEQRAALDLNSKEAFNREMGSKIQIIGWSLYALDLWVLKLCVAIFYSRLTIRLSHHNMRINLAYIIIGVSYVAVALSIILGCQPLSRNWQISPNPGNLCQPTVSLLNVLIVYIPNVLSDLYLLSIPLPLLWKVNISMRRKITLMGLFSGAVFVIAAATIRAVLIVTAGPEGAVTSAQWACREIFVSILVTNLPIIQPVLRRFASKIGLSVLFSRSGGDRSRGKTGTPNGAYALSSNPQKAGSKMSKGYGLGSRAKLGGSSTAGGMIATNTTTVPEWGSDDYILLDKGREGQKPGSTHEKDIVVGKQISVVTEPITTLSSKSGEGAGSSRNRWE